MIFSLVLPALSGLALVLSFTPVGISPLAWVAFVPLLFALHGAGRVADSPEPAHWKTPFSQGFVFGFVYFLGTVYWVVHSMFFYGGVGLVASIPVMLLLVAFLALFCVVFALTVSRYSPRSPLVYIFFVPSVWVLTEFVRGHIFTGFPWVLVGYTQAGWLPVIQVAELGGVWGVSFLVVMVNSAVFMALRGLRARRAAGPARAGGNRFLASPWVAAAAAAVLLTSALAYGFIRIDAMDERVKGWRPITVGIAQGNIEQGVKWDRSFRDSTLDIYRGLTLEAASKGADLVVWPETAAPFYLGSDGGGTARVLDIASDAGAYVLTGSPSYAYHPDTDSADFFNSAYLVTPGGALSGRYDKVHLVPFGEYVPLKRLLFFVKKLTHGVGDFSPGLGPYPVPYGHAGLGVLICYESIFPELASAQVRNGADLLVNITNDAWFGRTSAPWQHFEMSILRAVETRTYLIRSANTGISALIDPSGRVLGSTGLFEKGLLVEEARLRRGPLTFYTARGREFIILCWAVAVIGVMVAIVKRR